MGLDKNLLRSVKTELLKSAYVPPPPFNQNISQDMMMQAQQMGGQGMPMDPSMMGGMPPQGMPMDPSMMQGGGMPMDPSMMGGMPPQGMPMDPSMMQGGMPPQGGQGGMEIPPEILQQMMGGGGEAPAEPPAEEPAKANEDYRELEKRISQMEGKLDTLISIISGEKQSSDKDSLIYKVAKDLLKKK